MAESNALRHAYGGKVKYDDDGAGTNLTALSKVVSFKPWKDTRKPVMGTHLESTDGYEETVPAQGLQATDVATVTLRYTEAQYNSLQTLKFAGTEKYWYFMGPLMSGQTTASQQKGRGMVSSLELQEVNVEDDKTLMIQLEVTRTTARPTHTSGA